MSELLGRSARGRINQHPCVFALALQARSAMCSLVVHRDDLPYCSQPLARAHCARIEGYLRDNLRFALRLPNTNGNKTARLQLQTRGLKAMSTLLDVHTHAIDVQQLLATLQRQPQGLDSIAVPALLQAASA